MTAVAPQPIATRPYPARETVKGSFLLRLFRTTDHKQIGIMYLVTSFAFFMVGGAMAARPDSFDVLFGADVPALVVVGEEDPLTPPDAARAMADALPDSSLVVIPGTGHLTPLEAPDAVVSAILSWHDRHFTA